MSDLLPGVLMNSRKYHPCMPWPQSIASHLTHVKNLGDVCLQACPLKVLHLLAPIMT